MNKVLVLGVMLFSRSLPSLQAYQACQTCQGRARPTWPGRARATLCCAKISAVKVGWGNRGPISHSRFSLSSLGVVVWE